MNLSRTQGGFFLEDVAVLDAPDAVEHSEGLPNQPGRQMRRADLPEGLRTIVRPATAVDSQHRRVQQTTANHHVELSVERG